MRPQEQKIVQNRKALQNKKILENNLIISGNELIDIFRSSASPLTPCLVAYLAVLAPVYERRLHHLLQYWARHGVIEKPELKEWKNLIPNQIKWNSPVISYLSYLRDCPLDALDDSFEKFLNAGIVKEKNRGRLTPILMEKYLTDRPLKPRVEIKIVEPVFESKSLLDLDDELWIKSLGFLSLHERACFISRISKKWYHYVQSSEVSERAIVFTEEIPKGQAVPTDCYLLPVRQITDAKGGVSNPTVHQMRQYIADNFYRPQSDEILHYRWAPSEAQKRPRFYHPRMPKTWRILRPLMWFAFIATILYMMSVDFKVTRKSPIAILCILVCIPSIFLIDSYQQKHYPDVLDKIQLNAYLHQYAGNALENKLTHARPQGMPFRIFSRAASALSALRYRNLKSEESRLTL